MFSSLSVLASARRSFADCRAENAASRYTNPVDVLNRAALERDLPGFYIAERDLTRMQRLHARRLSKTIWDFGLLRDHPARRPNRQKAEFHLVFLLEPADLLKCQLLPPRPLSRPYLCYIRVNLDRRPWLLKLPVFRRPDILFVTFDLGDCLLAADGEIVLSGVTLPSPYHYEWPKRRIAPDNRYLLSFKGDCGQHGLFGSCEVRRKLKRLARPEGQEASNYLYVDTRDPGVERSKAGYVEILRDSTFALVPHGDGRWSHRLVEVIGAGAIPVIVADALTLPYEQLIDYDQICLRIPEAAVSNAESFEEILALLPTEPRRRLAMMEKLAEVQQVCFRDLATRIDMLLLAALRHCEAREVAALAPARRAGAARPRPEGTSP